MSNSTKQNARALAISTRVTLVAGIAGHLTLGLVCLWVSEPMLRYLWLPPFDMLPAQWLQIASGFDLAFAIGGMYAARQNNWNAVRLFLGFSGAYVAAFVATVTASFLFSGSDRPLVVWSYVVLALLYVPLVFLAWRRVSARLHIN